MGSDNLSLPNKKVVKQEHKVVGVKTVKISQDCMSSSDKVHSKVCQGKIFGCNCLQSGIKLNNKSVLNKENIVLKFKSDSKNSDKLSVNFQMANEGTKTVLDFNNLSECPKFPKQSSKIPKSKLHKIVSDVAMNFCRGKRKLCLVGSCMTVLIFSIATCLPFIIEKLRCVPDVAININPIYHHPQQPFTGNGRSPRTEFNGNSISDYNHEFLKQYHDVISQVYISVKTTSRYHYPRLVILLETWVNLVKDNTWFFTDSPGDKDLVRRTGDHLIVTNCTSSHHRLSLCCKMEQEFEHFLRSHRQWWCHFDDDNFVNVVALTKLLLRYDPGKPWYLGKTSTAYPLNIRGPDGRNSSFWFATGGAGFCVSRTLAMKMAPFAVDGKFVEAGNQFWLPDDVTLGYIIEQNLGLNLTVVPEFHSHLETMSSLTPDELVSDISFSYLLEDQKVNVVDISGPFPQSVDPTRFYSLYCKLFKAELCPS